MDSKRLYPRRVDFSGGKGCFDLKQKEKKPQTFLRIGIVERAVEGRNEKNISFELKIVFPEDQALVSV